MIVQAIGKVMAKVVELEQKIARSAAGGGDEAGDWCKKSLFFQHEHGSRDVRRQGGGLEKLAEG